MINDFRNNDPDISFYFDNGKWWYVDANKGSVEVNDFSVNKLIKIAGNQKVNINIPPPQPVAVSLKSFLLTYRNLQLVANPNDAQYALFGTLAITVILSTGL